MTASTLPGLVVTMPTRPSSSAALRPSPQILSMLSSCASTCRSRSARSARLSDVGAQFGTGRDHHGVMPGVRALDRERTGRAQVGDLAE